MPDPTPDLKQLDLAKQLATNPQVTEWLAKMVKDEMLTAFSSASAEMLAKAKAEVTSREKAVAAAVSGMTETGRAKMNRHQMNEFWRCTTRRLAGKGDGLKPAESLDADGIITQSLAESVGSAGGYMVLPEDATAEIHQQADEPLIIWPLLTKRPTSSDSVTSLEVTSYVTPSTGTAAKSTSATTADEVAVTEPVYGEVTWTLRAMDARVPIKLNLLDDAKVDLVGHINGLVADAFRTKQESWPIVGRGSAQQEAVGVLNAEAVITAETVPTTGVTDILEFVSKLPARYRISGSHRLCAGSTMYFRVISTLAQNVNSAQYLMKALPLVVEAPYISTGKLIVGDWSYYIVYHNPLMKVVSGIDTKRFTLELVFQSRWDGKAVIQDAFRIGNVTTYS